MSSFIDLNSKLRDANSYPNPCSYVVLADQVKTWVKESRQVMSNSARPGSRALEFAQSVEVKHFILPYSPCIYTDQVTGTVITTHTADFQRLYLDVHTSRYGDSGLINIIDGKIPMARFVLTRVNIQYDSNNIPVWVHFISVMHQTTRFPRNEEIFVNIMQEDGYIINTIYNNMLDPLTPSLQTYICLEIVPYFRDGEYDNHGLQLTTY